MHLHATAHVVLLAHPKQAAHLSIAERTPDTVSDTLPVLHDTGVVLVHCCVRVEWPSCKKPVQEDAGIYPCALSVKSSCTAMTEFATVENSFVTPR